MKNIKIFATSQSNNLGKKIAHDFGFPLGVLKTESFADGEMTVYYDESIRSHHIFVIASGDNPKSIIELCLVSDAAKRAGAKSVNLINTYYPYARQDRRDHHRSAIGASFMAKMITAAGYDSIITLDLHANQIEGFINIPLTHIQGYNIFLEYLDGLNKENTVIVSPDGGGVSRAMEFSSRLNTTLAVINKKRGGPGIIASMDLTGNVEGKECFIVDDMIDSGGSLLKAAELLKNNGAKNVSAIITHGVLSNGACDKIKNDKSLDYLWVSDSIPSVEEKVIGNNKIKLISCSQVFAKVLSAIYKKESVSKNLR